MTTSIEQLERLKNLSSAKRALLMKSIREKAAQPAASNFIQRKNSGEGSYPLSFAQQRLWFLDQLEPGSAFYNIPAAVRLSGPLNVAAMELSVSEIIRRHESLRTVFATENEVPTQIIFPARELSIPVTSLKDLPEAERESEARRLIAEEAGRPFDLTRGPLLRVGLLRLEEEEHVVMLTLHHIISDGWSMNVLIGEFFTLYEAFSRGAASPLAELPIQYSDYALWQREWLSGGILEKELAYWKEHLAGAPPVLELPTDHPRPAVQTFRGAMQKLRLSKELREKLLKLGRSEDATLFMTLLASFQTLLHRYAGQDDIVVGTPIAGRNRTEVESLIGFFVNTLVLRTDLSGAPSFRQLLRRVRETVLSAHTHQDVPFEKLVEELHPERSLSHSPLFQVMFTLLNAGPSSRNELAGLKLETLLSESHTAKFDLTLQINENDEELNASLEYNTDLFDEATIERLLEHYENLLANIVADPDEIITKLPLMSSPERERLLDLCSHNGTNYTPQCLHELFEQQAARTPNAIAIAFQDEALTYRELNERANQLARYLQQQGVGPETMVGLMIERSIEMVVGLLGVLKAGGAYVPLDPQYPQDRLSFMMEDSQARVLLTQQHLVERLAGCAAQVVCIDDDWTAIEKEEEQNLSVQMTPDSLAYVIYTSGSTGKPKGVMVTHSNLSNFLVGMDERLLSEQPESATDLEVGTWLAVTSISFDISVLELFWTLARGWRVVIQTDSHSAQQNAAFSAFSTDSRIASRPMEFSLFYFASSESEEALTSTDKYRLLIEGARFADEHEFAAVWTPERHFHAFGGLYPNPSVVSAALALVTRNVALRAGSVVLPLHSSIRVAEEWSVVDNLSGGRVGISFASGWHANDFVLAPEVYAERQKVMYERIEEVRRLWRGEALTLRDGAGAETEIRTLPRPIQAELPIWVTAAGSVETFKSAGRVGAGLLTHLLGQSVEELGEKLSAYREAWKEAGHAGEGQVTLMLHTFVGEDMEQVRETVRGPFSDYLKTSIGLMKNLAKSFGQDIDSAGFTQDDMDALLAHAFTRYFETSGLFGTPESCLEMVGKLKSIGVDEIACLVDFGIEADEVLANLEYLNEVRMLSNRPQEKAEETDSLLAQLGKYEVTHLQCTPSLAGMLMQDTNALTALGGLHKLMLGGEALPLSLAQKLTESLPAELHNMYGPTETTIWSATHHVRRVTDYVPLGRPIANTQIYILNKHLEPQPLRVAGEIFIGGDGVVRGYLERPELTAERFIADPFGRQPGVRMYRTGDLGRYLPNGELEFLGRVDHQVKIRGHRIEVGEIEVALNEHVSVREAVVIARESAPGEKDLVAYVVPEGTAPAAGEWRRFLKEKLPDYMIPSIFVNLDAMPLTPNGKIDRKALPAPDQSRRELGAEFVAPRTPTEQLLASIWCDVLRTEQVGVFDNFFELGGHSLLATQLVSRVREVFGVELPLRSLFESPTIAGLALSVEQRRSAGHGVAAPPLLPVARDNELPLSFAQQRLWFLHQLEPDNPFYNVPVAVRLRGRLDVAALEQTLSEIIRRHEVLRTTFDNIEGRAAQVINPPENLTLLLVDLSDMEEREEEAVRLANQEAQRPFDLSRGPLLRAQVLRLSAEDHIVLLTMHHIVSDAWSTNLLIGEVGTLYKAYLEHQPSPLAEMAIQYADFAVWQREWLQGEALEQQLDYWRQQLRGVPVLEVQTDKARPVEQTYKGAHFHFELDEQTAAGLMRLSQQQGATLFMTLLAAFQSLLHRYTSQTDIAVGTPIAGRNRSETESLIGFFINTLVLRTDATGDPTFTELLRRVREVCLGAYAHQDVPFERLVDELQPERDLSRHPLFQVSFNLQNAPLDTLELPELSLDKFSGDAEVSQFDLALEVREVAGRLSGLLQYNTDLFEEATIAAMAGHFERLITAVLADAGQRISQLPILDEDERHRLLVEWNEQAATIAAPSAPPVFAGCVHELFEAQAARTPEAVAVECEGELLTYGELNAKANQLARHLRALGVGTEAPVGLYIDRSLEMVVGLLGILKAGGAYLPLDPQYPQARLNFMIEDAKVATLLTRSYLIDVLPEIHEEHVVWLDTGWDTISTESTENLTSAALPDNLAYIIYTSGSTGLPKGVGISHRVAAEHLTSIRETFELDSSDRVLQFASLNFDVSLEQLLPSLLLGAKVVLRDDRLWGASDLARHLQEEKLTVVNFPTAYWHQLAQECAASSELTSAHDLRLVIIGGDMILPEVVRLWQSTPMKNVRLLNAYGPTECAITAATFEIPTGGAYRKLPIGRPTAHRAMYVLDAYGGPVPVGVAGELHIGGPLLARGYLGRADLTADSFVPDPFSQDPGARMYRSGDLVRYLPDGNLEFLGRRDDQVKVRGFRIELGEIEAALVEHASVREAVVLARKDGGAVEKRLVAYVVPREDSVFELEDVRRHLHEKLPVYMQPAAFVLLEELPLTPNGKVNRHALPAPDETGSGREAVEVQPRSHAEELLAGIWKAVLGLDAVGIHDNFFEVGGDSILSLQIIAKARKAGLQLSPKQVFDYPTIAGLAGAAETAVAVLGEQGTVIGEVPLTPVQQRFFEQQQPEPHHFNQAVMLESKEPLDATLLERAVAKLLEHHDALRLRFKQEEGTWRQVNTGSANVNEVFTRIDFSHLPQAEHKSAIEEAAERVQSSLSFSTGPLVRIVMFDLGAGRSSRLLLVIHHLLIDGVSWRILLEDLQKLYAQLSNDQQMELEPKTTSFKRWAEQLSEHALSQQGLRDELAYWLTPERSATMSLPLDNTSGSNTIGASQTFTTTLTAAETAALLHEVPRAYHTQINDVLLTALAQSFSRWTKHRSILVDLEGHGREELFASTDVSRTVGWFTSIFPVLLEVGEQARPGDDLKSIKEQLRAVPQRGIGYGLLRYLSGDAEVSAQLGAMPQAEVVFNYLGQFDQTLSESSPFRIAQESSGHDQSAHNLRQHLLEVNASVAGGQLRINWTYSEEFHHSGTIEKVASHYGEALRTLIEQCSTATGAHYTVSDFALADLDQLTLERLLTAYPETEDIYTLSPTQQGILFHTLYSPGEGEYVGHIVWTFHGELNVEALAQAAQQVLQQHPILRTRFIWEGVRQPLQLVDRQASLSITEEDWRDQEESTQHVRFEHLLDADRRAGFDLTRAPLMRLHLIRLSEQSYKFVWSHHHLLLDGWSHSQILKEVLVAYQALSTSGQMPQLGAAPRPYRDYIAWLKREQTQTGAKAEKWWREYLGGFTAPTRLGVERVTNVGAAAETASQGGFSENKHALSLEATESLRRFAARERLTLNTVVQGAWALLLSRYSSERDVVFGTTVAGRPADLAGVEQMVGLFINTLPVRVRVESGETASVGEWLRALQSEQSGMREYEHVPLVEVQRWSEVGAGRQLFDYLFVFENYPVDDVLSQQSEGLFIDDVKSIERPHYPLALVAGPSGEQLTLHLIYDENRFEKQVVEQILRHMDRLLEAMASDTQQTINRLPMLDPQERALLLSEWNATASDYPRQQSLPELFEEQAARTPDAVALVFDNQQLTYAELNNKANQLAHYLRKQGVGPEVPVGIMLERSPELIIALLGVLKAGGYYVPLDLLYPQERISFMLEDARVAVLLTDERQAENLPSHSALVVRVDADAQEIAQHGAENPPMLVAPENLAYVIYTSGSTGRPKGVSVPQRAVVRLVKETNFAELGSDEVILQYAPVSFDASTLEIWGSLLNGARLVIMPSRQSSLEELGRMLVHHEVTTLWLTAGLFHLMVEERLEDLQGVRQLLAGGDVLSVPHVKRVLTRLPGIKVINGYGPTENTTFTCCYTMTDESQIGQTVSIGRPIANTQIFVLDDRMQPVPVGVAGELYIGGDGLARDYLKRPALTAEKFVPHPFSADPGARLYRTGDLVRYLPDGNVEFLGRRDNQVKVRGFRIELGEIESAIGQYAGVREVVVLAQGEGAGDKHLTAYVVPEDTDSFDTGELRRHLKELMPEYMLPQTYVILAELPLTPNGKVDRRALPVPDDARPQPDETFVAARTPLEEVVCRIWQEVLGVERIGAHDNFFELGGHSLSATQVVSRLREALQVELPLHVFFSEPTVAEVAVAAERLQAERDTPQLPAITWRLRRTEAPLSFAQQRLWFLDQLQPASPFYNIPVAVRLKGQLDAGALEQTLNEIISRHEVLRTVFAAEGGTPVQVIMPSMKLTIPHIDLAGMPVSRREAEARELITKEARRPFDLAQGPLVRATLLRLEADEHILLMTMHHVVSDGWSMGVAVREVAALYKALVAGEASPLEALPVQYADYAAWQRESLTGDLLKAHLDYWEQQLKGAATLALPTDKPRPEEQTFNGAYELVSIPQDLTAALKALGEREGTTLFMTLLAAYQTLLSYYSRQDDISVGTDIANRNRQEIEGLIGFFINQLVLRTDLSGNPSFAELLRRVRATTIGAYAHQDMPFELLVDALKVERSLKQSALFQVKLVLQNTPQQALELPGLTLHPVEVDYISAKFDLTLLLTETPDGIVGNFEYNTDLFAASTMNRLAKLFGELLRYIAAEPDATLETLKEKMMELDQQDKATEKRRRADLNRQKLKNIKPRRVTVKPEELVKREALQAGGTLPLVIQPLDGGVDLVAWVNTHRVAVEADLVRHGAILFRGFEINLQTEFEKFAQGICSELFEENGEHPRGVVSGKVYTPVFYPPDQHLLWHNENSFNYRWPTKIMFACVHPPDEGGETPIVDSSQVFDRLDAKIKERFVERRIMYVRNYSSSLGLDWQTVFQTTDRAVVEQYCRQTNMEFEWKEDGQLRTRCVRPAVIRHPSSDVLTWFNQAQHWHVSCLDPATRDSVRSLFREEDFPRHCYYGDGSPIEDSVMTEILGVYQELEVSFPWQQRDILVLDNLLTAHARNRFKGQRKLLVAMGDMLSYMDVTAAGAAKLGQ
jgi:natural product biosynthesis luciferase-like monooxygenase protein/amino acid adenylation domain-containing protein/non-ribosomal peptide synthase protein (TIGR01720 family)